MEENSWVEELKEKRGDYGISQNKLAVADGITRQYLSDIETFKVRPSAELQVSISKALERFNSNSPLEMLFDYVRICFPTLDVKYTTQIKSI